MDTLETKIIKEIKIIEGRWAHTSTPVTSLKNAKAIMGMHHGGNVPPDNRYNDAISYITYKRLLNK